MSDRLGAPPSGVKAAVSPPHSKRDSGRSMLRGYKGGLAAEKVGLEDEG